MAGGDAMPFGMAPKLRARLTRLMDSSVIKMVRGRGGQWAVGSGLLEMLLQSWNDSRLYCRT